MVLKPQNQPVQLNLMADGPPVPGHPSMANLFDHAYEIDQLQGRILNPSRTNGNLKATAVTEYMEQER